MYKNSDMSIGKRIREARTEAGLSQKQLATKAGVSQSAISQLETGESQAASSTASMAAALGVNALWLESGKGPKRADTYTGEERRAENRSDKLTEDSPYAHFNAGPNLELRPGRYVAIVGIGQGGPDGYISIDDYPSGQGDGRIYTYSPDPDAYAIRVRGDSMRPRIKSGEYIVAEPGVEAQPGDDVVVKLRNDKAMVKELLWVRDGEISFGSINDSVPPITLQLQDIICIHRVAAIVPRGSALIQPY
ncbi:hypothetical protein ASE07_06305 [Noviherbaspirillum sp. Root189]|nr:hypothetical protein ASE07_06305 [Noviherbaspirillum sp. Root189]